MFICLASSKWGLLRLLSETGAEKLPLYDIGGPQTYLVGSSPHPSRRQNWTLTLFLLPLLTNAGTDRINNLFPSLMFTPAWYNEDKSDGGGHTTIQLLSPDRGSCKGNSSRHRWQGSKSTTRIKPSLMLPSPIDPTFGSILVIWTFRMMLLIIQLTMTTIRIPMMTVVCGVMGDGLIVVMENQCWTSLSIHLSF